MYVRNIHGCISDIDGSGNLTLKVLSIENEKKKIKNRGISFGIHYYLCLTDHGSRLK